ncbi:MAG: endonuclease/exonuclease/phosphatase family protein, partial [Actinomycetota bacterium]|nr:endonuclease/exonuclease/phosphatase family protein [Actinomycetota bacterium]
LRDAQDVGGGGFVPTWPVGGALPALLRLDHILVGPGIGVADVSVIGPLGADHRGVEAQLRVPRS